MESTQNKIYEIEEANEQAVPRMRLEDDEEEGTQSFISRQGRRQVRQ